MMENHESSVFEGMKNIFSSLENFGNFGDGLGGIVGVLIGGLTACLVYQTYKVQKAEIKRLTNESNNKILLEMLITLLLPQIKGIIDELLKATQYTLPDLLARCKSLAGAHNALARGLAKLPDSQENNAILYIGKNMQLMRDLVKIYDFTKKKINESETDQYKEDYIILLNYTISDKEIEIIRTHVMPDGISGK